MPSLLDVRSILQSRREQKTGDLVSLARQVATDQSVDPDELLAAVSSAGMTDDDFLDLVDMIRNRNELRRTAATKRAADQEVETIEAAIGKHRAALEEAEAKYRRAVEPLEVQLSEARARAASASLAEGALLSPRNLPKPFLARLEAARKRLLETSSVVQKTERHIAQQTARAEDALAMLEAEGGFEKAAAKYDDPDRRSLLSSMQRRHVEDVRGGRHQVKEAAQDLVGQKLAEQAAREAFQAIERECAAF